MIDLYYIISQLYSGHLEQIVDVFNKYTLCHVESCENLNVRGIHTGFYFLTQHNKLCEVFYVPTHKTLYFQGVVNEKSILRPLGLIFYINEGDVDNGFRVRFYPKQEMELICYWKFDEVNHKLYKRIYTKAVVKKVVQYNTISFIINNYFLFHRKEGDLKYPLYCPHLYTFSVKGNRVAL